MIENNYGFVLEFSELSEELQNQKIDEVIEYNFNHNNYDEDKYGDAEDALEDEKLRGEESDYISTHFPIYF